MKIHDFHEKSKNENESLADRIIASILHEELMFIQDVVSWYEVEITIVMSPNKVRDSEMLRLAARGKPSAKLPRGRLFHRCMC